MDRSFIINFILLHICRVDALTSVHELNCTDVYLYGSNYTGKDIVGGNVKKKSGCFGWSSPLAIAEYKSLVMMSQLPMKLKIVSY